MKTRRISIHPFKSYKGNGQTDRQTDGTGIYIKCSYKSHLIKKIVKSPISTWRYRKRKETLQNFFSLCVCVFLFNPIYPRTVFVCLNLNSSLEHIIGYVLHRLGWHNTLHLYLCMYICIFYIMYRKWDLSGLKTSSMFIGKLQRLSSSFFFMSPILFPLFFYSFLLLVDLLHTQDFSVAKHAIIATRIIATA